jgi:hypothetical protein
LLARFSGVVKPADFLEKMWVREIVDLTWESLRWRRLATSLHALAVPPALEAMLGWIKGPDPAKGLFPDPDSVFRSEPPTPEHLLAKKWAAKNPAATKRVDKILAKANISMDSLCAKALASEINIIERIDRLATVAEARRNATLREIERHRANLAQILRDKLRHEEQAEYKIIARQPINSEDETGSNVS